MANEDTRRQNPALTVEGMFVVQLRSDSAVARQHLVGRIEHVKSGDSEPFASLAALLSFIDRHVAGPSPSPTASSQIQGGNS